MSKKGYIKRLPIDEYRVQNRGGTGSRGASTTEGDYIQDIVVTNTHTDLLFFTSLGRVFRIRAHQIPQLGKNAKGLPIINLIQITKDLEHVKSIISLDDYGDNDLLFITEKGVVKKTAAAEFERINRNGKRAITLKDDDHLLGVTPIPSTIETEVILGNSNGKAIRFSSNDIRAMGRNAAGVRGITIDDGEVVDYASSARGHLILSISENGFGKLTELEDYRITKRGGKGVITINTDKAGKLIGLTAVKGDEDLMIITDKGTVIRTELSQISQFSRNSKGVTIVKLRDDEKITSTSVVRSLEEIEEEIIEKTKEIVLDISLPTANEDSEVIE
jgi:DNA gyrase subunit A